MRRICRTCRFGIRFLDDESAKTTLAELAGKTIAQPACEACSKGFFRFCSCSFRWLKLQGPPKCRSLLRFLEGVFANPYGVERQTIEQTPQEGFHPQATQRGMKPRVYVVEEYTWVCLFSGTLLGCPFKNHEKGAPSKNHTQVSLEVASDKGKRHEATADGWLFWVCVSQYVSLCVCFSSVCILVCVFVRALCACVCFTSVRQPLYVSKGTPKGPTLKAPHLKIRLAENQMDLHTRLPPLKSPQAHRNL